MKTALIQGAAVATVVVASVALFASPSYASGRSIPSGDSMYAVACDSSEANGQLLSLDPVSGNSTEIGHGTTASGCGAEAAWDAATNTAYYMDFAGNWPFWSVNLATGVSTPAFQPTLGGVAVQIDGLAITPTGAAYAVNYAGDTLYSISLSTGIMTNPVPLGVNDSNEFFLATDPQTGVLYGLTASDNDLYRIDPHKGSMSLLASSLPISAGDIAESMEVDSAGIVWIDETPDNDGDPTDFLSVDPHATDIAGSAMVSGTLTDAGNVYSNDAFFDVPAPAKHTTPNVDSLYTVGCDPDQANGQLMAVDGVTGDSTAIGQGAPATSGCALEAAWDPATCTAYFQDNDANGSFYAINLQTGSSTFAFQPTIAGAPNNVFGFAVTPEGNAYAVGDGGTTLYSVSLETGAMTAIGPLGVIDKDDFYLAADPTTGEMYGLTYTDHDLYRVNTATGMATLLAASLPVTAGDTVQSMEVNSAGTVVMVESINGGGQASDLVSFDPKASDIAATATVSPTLTAQGTEYFDETLIDVPATAAHGGVKSGLATTGVDAGPASWLGSGLVVVGILTAGLGMAIRRRRMRVTR